MVGFIELSDSREWSRVNGFTTQSWMPFERTAREASAHSPIAITALFETLHAFHFTFANINK